MKLSDLDLLSLGNTIQLAGAIFAGEGRALLCFFPGDDEGLPIENLMMDSEDWTRLLRQTDLLEAEVLTQASDGALAKAILRKSQRQIAQDVSWKVYQRDGFCCRYCGAHGVPLTVDHLVLWEEGGPSTQENLVAADRRCNKTRGHLSYDRWLESTYYKRVSAGLTEEQRKRNRDLLPTLAAIPRVLHKAT